MIEIKTLNKSSEQKKKEKKMLHARPVITLPTLSIAKASGGLYCKCIHFQIYT